MDKIYEILEEIRPESNFRESDDYINDYLIDSYDIYVLISEIEENYSICIEPEDVIPENFKNAKTIVEMMMKYKHIEI